IGEDARTPRARARRRRLPPHPAVVTAGDGCVQRRQDGGAERRHPSGVRRAVAPAARYYGPDGRRQGLAALHNKLTVLGEWFQTRGGSCSAANHRARRIYRRSCCRLLSLQIQLPQCLQYLVPTGTAGDAFPEERRLAKDASTAYA